MRVAILLLLFASPCLLPAQRESSGGDGTNGSPPPSGIAELRAAIAATNTAIRASCPHSAPEDRGALLETESARSAVVRRGRATASDWHALGCARALLYAADVIAREGVLMSLGDSWHKGATRSLLEALALEPGHAASAELLGELALAENHPAEQERIGQALGSAAELGARGAMTLRGCAEFNRRAGDRQVAARCGELALEAGVDSTWQLVHLAWLRFVAADTTEGQRLFHRAVATARDSASWAPIVWQLRWFLEPEEEAEWSALPDSLRTSWVRDRFTMRDVRDGRAPGSRMAEHFARLAYADSAFRRGLHRSQWERFQFASTPDNPLGYGWVAKWVEPGVVPAQPWRFYLGRHPGFDDRAAVWMRWGRPETRIPWSGGMYLSATTSARPTGYCASGLVEHEIPEYGIQLCHPSGSHHNVREAWLYRLDGGGLLVHFEGEQFDGSAEATRLVAGVLGSYLCDIDSRRCSMTNRATATPSIPTFPPLNPETVGQLRLEDEAMLELATTTDDNAVRGEHPIATVATLARVWDPRSGAQLAVVPYAVKVGDVAREEDSTGVTATIALTLRQWDGRQGSWQETDAVRRLRLPARLRGKSHLTGYLVVPTTPSVSAWSLVASQGADRRGRAWQVDTRSLDSGPLVLSDLILGATSQGQTWHTTGGTDVPLGPLGAFDRNEPLTVYWQVQSTTVREDATIRVALVRVTPREEREALALEFAARIGAGLTELQRLVGIERLDDGEYRLEVTVTDADGTVARRSARLLVR